MNIPQLCSNNNDDGDGDDKELIIHSASLPLSISRPLVSSKKRKVGTSFLYCWLLVPRKWSFSAYIFFFSPNLSLSVGEGSGNPLQYSCLENPMDRGAWPATVHGVRKSRIQLRTNAFLSILCLLSSPMSLA